MKNLSLIALGLSLSGGSAFAVNDFVDTAQIVSSKPIIERVSESRQECDAAPAPQRSSSGAGSIIAPILGGVVGGLLGHQVGQGSGKTAATIVGATGGAVAGSVINNRSGNNDAQSQQQCRTVESSREVVNGYDVVYRYNGRDVNVAMPYDPGVGRTVKVGVAMILDDPSADSARRGERNPRSANSSYGDDDGGYRQRGRRRDNQQ